MGASEPTYSGQRSWRRGDGPEPAPGLAADDLCRAQQAISRIAELAATDEEFLADAICNPETALRRMGCEPNRLLVGALRSRLKTLGGFF